VRTLSLFAVGLAVVGLVASAAPAQQRRGGGGPVMYLSAKSVQDELKLSEDDAKKVTDALRGLDRNLSREERAEKTKQILKDNLKEDQIKRLNQIMWQREGIGRAIANPDVQTALKLDDKQKDQVKTIEEDSRKKISDLGRPSADNREKIQELRKKSNEDITAVLTDDQKKAWKDLLGPEFKGEIPRPGR
jgi:Spy/CpxP family protein refolding chaperone